MGVGPTYRLRRALQIWSDRQTYQGQFQPHTIFLSAVEVVMGWAMKRSCARCCAGPDGRQQAMALTDFEGTSARKAFPCFDEPQLKVQLCSGVARFTSEHMHRRDQTFQQVQHRIVHPHLTQLQIRCTDALAQASFQLNMTAARGLTALSNSPAASVSEAGGKLRHTFEETQPMSTYLLAMVVSTGGLPLRGLLRQHSWDNWHVCVHFWH